MNASIAVLMTALALTQHSAMPAGMSHQEHLKQLAKDDALKQRGGKAMGFDQDTAEHHFILEAAGGSIRVTVKADADRKVLEEVRRHLRTIAGEFSQGDFGKPFQTHDQVPAGVAEMKSAARAITYRYEDVAGGGALRIRTMEAGAVRAIHEFLRYQIREHKTGDSLRPQ